uniref:Uncharacterized protein n=1 Tax=Panagrolaimus superbus TaxID=310955 RepID=A0A914Z926_9BILA
MLFARASLTNESDIEEEDEIEVVAADIPSTSNTTDNSIKLNKFNQKKSVRTENINDGIQPCSSKTPIWANISQNGIQNHDLTQMPSTSAAPGSSNVLKVGLEYRRHLPPQMRHKHPYVAYKRFRDAFSDTLGTKYQPPGIDPSLYEIIKDRISHLLPSEEELRDPNSLPFKRYRKALSQELAKAYKTGELPEDDTLQYAILNHEIQMNEIIIDQIEDKHRIESDRIKERDKITRRMIEERYEVEKEKVEKQYETAVAQLAEKMIAENEEERRQLEAELAVIGEDGEVPANFNYLPNRKQLRRRTGNLNDSSSVIEHSDKIDPYVPIHQVHWIDPNDINNDLNIFNSVLQSFSDEGPFEKHLSMQIQEGKLLIASSQKNNPVVFDEIRLSNFKTKKVKVTLKIDINSFHDLKVEPIDEDIMDEKLSKMNLSDVQFRFVFDKQNFGVFAVKDDKEQIQIRASNGSEKIPIYIAFTDKKPVIGKAAKEAYAQHPKLVVFGKHHLFVFYLMYLTGKFQILSNFAPSQMVIL